MLLSIDPQGPLFQFSIHISITGCLQTTPHPVQAGCSSRAGIACVSTAPLCTCKSYQLPYAEPISPPLPCSLHESSKTTA